MDLRSADSTQEIGVGTFFIDTETQSFYRVFERPSPKKLKVNMVNTLQSDGSHIIWANGQPSDTPAAQNFNYRVSGRALKRITYDKSREYVLTQRGDGPWTGKLRKYSNKNSEVQQLNVFKTYVLKSLGMH